MKQRGAGNGDSHSHQYSYGRALDRGACENIDAYWRAANYVSVGQIYPLENPLLTEPLKVEHVKPRLLGRWGTAAVVGWNVLWERFGRRDLYGNRKEMTLSAVAMARERPAADFPSSRSLAVAAWSVSRARRVP